MRDRLKIFALIAIVSVATTFRCQAQRVAVASNAVEWLVLAPNISGEVVLTHTSSMTLDLTIDPGFSVMDDVKFNNTTIRYSYRRWFNQALYAHFVGANIMATDFDVAAGKKLAYCGSMVGVGVTYGYSWVLNDRWNVVPTIGLGGGLYSPSGGGGAKFRPMLTDFGVRMQYIIK